MNTERRHVGDHMRDVSRRKKQLLNNRRKELLLREAHKRGVKLPDVFTSDPQGREGEQLERTLKTKVERHLRDMATAEKLEERQAEVFVKTDDKTRQNIPNTLTTPESAGDSSMDSYWDAEIITAIEMSASIASRNGREPALLFLTRVSPKSDESITIPGGVGLPENTKKFADNCWNKARRMIDLRNYPFSIIVQIGSERYEAHSDLHAYASVLKHPETALHCKSFTTPLISIDPNAKPGFLQRVIKDLSYAEIPFFNHLPSSIRGIEGLAAARSPFKASTNSNKKSGVFVELKLEMPEGESAELFRFVRDNWDGNGSKGTRKGIAEVFSRVLGLRGLNTFAGKAAANSVLTAVAHAMADLEKSGVTVSPANGNYLQYWIDLPADNGTRRIIEDAIRRRIQNKKNKGPGYLDVPFDPHVAILDAKDVNVDDLRALFILQSLGKDSYPVETLRRTDFLLNFIENVRYKVRDRVFDEVGINGENREFIKMIERTCYSLRTMRDTEDFVHALRNYEDMPGDIKAKRATLESWLFDFAHEKFEQVFMHLAKVMEENTRKRRIS